MKLYVRVWCPPDKRVNEVLGEMCLSTKEPIEVTGVAGVLQLAEQMFDCYGLNVMILHHVTEADAMWLCLDTRQFQTRS